MIGWNVSLLLNTSFLLAFFFLTVLNLSFLAEIYEGQNEKEFFDRHEGPAFLELQLNEYNLWDFSRILFHLGLFPSVNKLLGKMLSIKVVLYKSDHISPRKKGHLDAQILLGLCGKPNSRTPIS